MITGISGEFITLTQVSQDCITFQSGLQAGHAVHEDEASRVADVFLSFLDRFQIGKEKKLPSWTKTKPE